MTVVPNSFLLAGMSTVGMSSATGRCAARHSGLAVGHSRRAGSAVGRRMHSVTRRSLLCSGCSRGQHSVTLYQVLERVSTWRGGSWEG